MRVSDELPPVRLIGEACVPTNRTTDDELTDLRAAELITHRNFTELVEVFDGPTTRGCLVVSTADDPQRLPLGPTEFAKFRLYRRLHNYLASVYSLNEQVRFLVNSALGDPEAVDSPLGRGSFVPNDATTYTRKLAFVRGLRIDFQHGDFRSVELELVPDPDPNLAGETEDVYRVVFDKQTFRSGFVDDPDKYLKHYPDRRFRHVVSYLDSFHEEVHQFAAGTREWLAGDDDPFQ